MEEIEKNEGTKIGLILLAAGESSRLEHPKQLLNYAGQTLLEYSLDVARHADASPIVVILGADADLIEKKINNQDIHVVINNNWKEGMASSIRCGINELNRLFPDVEGAVVMACDQPYVTAALINWLIKVHHETAKPLVSCQYSDTVGIPSFFHKSMFPELLALEGDVGAKSLLLQNAEKLEIVHFPEGKVDIDTEADYEKLKRRK